jgi:hypothetical protein
MKTRNNIFAIVATILAIVSSNENASAQQYKLQQVTSVMSMTSETTIYVKGMRKRTEGHSYAGMPNNITTIEQCDLQRTISVNDKKKLYYIEPFSKERETVVYEDEKPLSKNKPVATPASMSSQKGGVVTMFYNITDTGDRKKMYGMTARHIWTTQKIKPSPDACMKDSMIMKTDGWYIDLPEFSCPVRYTAINTGGMGGADCKDRYITRQSGKGKLGFPLIEKRIMIMGNGVAETTRFETNLETIEFSTAKLDSMLFEIPPGYRLAKDITELQDRIDAASIIGNYEHNKGEENKQITSATPKITGALRIAVLEPVSNEQLNISELQSYLVTTLRSYNMEAIAVTSVEDARKHKCDVILDSKIIQVKQSNKVGGFLRAVRNVDPYTSSTYNIEVQFLLSKLADGSAHSQKTVSGKFEGTANNAVKKSMYEGSRMLLKDLHQ